MILKVIYIGKTYFFYSAIESCYGEDEGVFEVREDLASSWIEGNEYSEVDKDFSTEIRNDGTILLVPYIDKNQLKLFDPVNQ